ncbi:MAG: hypothetical protein CMI52_04045 [Parcubacteria group bacterium]|nr:hypothetical protein [Parcubacteria group bacterium]|tara:strand:+ start:229 stop:1008 length:780 start_codon:yes stop_codon:yes gene_type:complete
MTAILLAAGRGMRLKPYTHDRTKGLVEAAGRPLFDYVLNFLRDIGVDQIIVVGGFEAEKVRTYLNKNAPDVTFLKIDDVTKGNLGTLLTALPHMNDSLLIINSDHIYKRSLASVIKKQCFGITAFCDTDRVLGTDDMKVKRFGNNVKKISKQLIEWTNGYVGMTYIDKTKLPLYRATANKLYKDSDGTIAVEGILAQLADDEQDVHIGDISGHGWLEIDNEEELIAAERTIAQNPSQYIDINFTETNTKDKLPSLVSHE